MPFKFITIACALISLANDALAENLACSQELLHGERVLALADLDPVTREGFLRTEQRGSEPGCLVLDFNADGKQDLALIAVSKDARKSTLRIFLAVGRTLQQVVSTEYEGIGTGVFLTRRIEATLKHTEAIEPEDGVPVISPITGGEQLRLTHFEKAEIVFYFDSLTKSVQSVQTAD